MQPPLVESRDRSSAAGLALLRIVAVSGLFRDVPSLTNLTFPAKMLAWTLLAALSGALLAGFRGRWAAALLGIVEVWTASGGAETAALLAGVDLSLVLLGPGAWSMDALSHRRRRIDLDSL